MDNEEEKKKDFPEMELSLGGLSSDPKIRKREIQEMRMKAGLEEPDEEYLSKYGKPTHNPPPDADVENIDLYNGDITYFKTTTNKYLKFDRNENKGYILTTEDGKTFWKYKPELQVRYEYGDISGYKIKPGYFKDNYETVDELKDMFNDFPSVEELRAKFIK